MRALLVILGFLACCAHAEVFRCLTPEGKTLYSDSPCPRGSETANISSEVGECSTQECVAERERTAMAARERLKQDKEALAAMAAERRKAQAEALAERVKLEQLRRLAAIDQRLAAEAEAAAQPRLSYPAYPWYPLLSCPPLCVARPPLHRHPPMQPKPERPREPSVSLRDPAPKP